MGGTCILLISLNTNSYYKVVYTLWVSILYLSTTLRVNGVGGDRILIRRLLKPSFIKK